MSGRSDRPSEGGPNGAGPTKETATDNAAGGGKPETEASGTGEPESSARAGAPAAGDAESPDSAAGTAPTQPKTREITRKVSAHTVRAKAGGARPDAPPAEPAAPATGGGTAAAEESGSSAAAAASAAASGGIKATAGPRLTMTPTQPAAPKPDEPKPAEPKPAEPAAPQTAVPATGSEGEPASDAPEPKPAKPAARKARTPRKAKAGARSKTSAKARSAAKAKAAAKPGTTAAASKAGSAAGDAGVKTAGAEAAEAKSAEAETPEPQTAGAKSDGAKSDGAKSAEAKSAEAATAEAKNGQAPKVDQEDRISQPVTVYETAPRRRSRGWITIPVLLLIVLGGGYLAWSQGYLDGLPFVPPSQPMQEAEAPPEPPAPEQQAAAPGLTPDELEELETMLDRLAFAPGDLDGVIDEQTHDAIRQFQDYAGLPVDGEPSQEVLEALRLEVDEVMKLMGGE